MADSISNHTHNFTTNPVYQKKQLEIVARSSPKLRLRPSDRFLIGIPTDLYHSWKEALLIAKPETIIHHKNGALWTDSCPQSAPPVTFWLQSYFQQPQNCPFSSGRGDLNPRPLGPENCRIPPKRRFQSSFPNLNYTECIKSRKLYAICSHSLEDRKQRT